MLKFHKPLPRDKNSNFVKYLIYVDYTINVNEIIKNNKIINIIFIWIKL